MAAAVLVLMVVGTGVAWGAGWLQLGSAWGTITASMNGRDDVLAAVKIPSTAAPSRPPAQWASRGAPRAPLAAGTPSGGPAVAGGPDRPGASRSPVPTQAGASKAGSVLAGVARQDAARAAGAIATVVSLANAERLKVGCPALRVDPRLSRAAQAHTTDMAVHFYFSHLSRDGRTPAQRAVAAGYPAWSAENIAMAFPTSQAVMVAWSASPVHRANLLDCRSRAVGVGFDSRGGLWTEDFGSV